MNIMNNPPEGVSGYWIDEYGNKNIKFVVPITQVKEFKAVPMYMFNDKITWNKYNEN